MNIESNRQHGVSRSGPVSAEFVKIRCEGAVLSIGFDRPSRKNALTAPMYTALADALDWAATDDSGIKAVLLHGSESVFCAGNDLEDFLARPASSADSPVFRFLRVLSEFDRPLVAAVCGPAVGVGATMLLHCDFVHAGHNAQLSFPFVQLGVCPEAGSSLLLPARVGHARAAQLFLLGEPLDAECALANGLVNSVAPAAEVEARARNVCRTLAERPLSALRTTKRLMREPIAATLAAVMDQERQHFSRMLHEPAAREAMTAFMQKRRPDFSGL